MDKSTLPDATVSRAFKKKARADAGIRVDQQVKDLETEIRQLSQANSCTTFLTTSGMVRSESR
jgi:hypothetical protein